MAGTLEFAEASPASMSALNHPGNVSTDWPTTLLSINSR
jgi:hypothetical protein